MSRYRAIHCLIWNDDKFPFLSDEGKLVFLHLLTTTMSTPFGCFKAGKAALAEESRMNPEGYAKGFREGLDKGLFKYDETFHVVFIPRFIRYNPPTNPNVVKKWAKTFGEVPPSALKQECYLSIRAACKEYSEGFMKAFDQSFGKEPRKDMPIQYQYQEQYQEQEKEYSCPEQSSEPNPAEEPVLLFPIVGDPDRENHFPVHQSDIDSWKEAFPGVDVEAELLKCKQWSIDNPKRRKTKSGIRNHIRSWMDRAQNSSRASPTAGTPSAPKDIFDYSPLLHDGRTIRLDDAVEGEIELLGGDPWVKIVDQKGGSINPPEVKRLFREGRLTVIEQG